MTGPTHSTLLGGRDVGQFLAGWWHKRALLVRGALPGFAGLYDRAELFALAGRDDVESRVVLREGRRWTLLHGPFRRRDFSGLPPRDWTLLVQGVNLASAAADALLRRFAFLPYARLDDLMVSYAVPGGGVGPHFDSYDVFLLQGQGRRRWRYGPQDDLALVPNLPIKILRHLTPAHDDLLGPGDMLYLPPQYAHDGVAVDECTTYSIGFRAPSYEELGQAFLDFLRDRVTLPGRYADPDLAVTRHPARIDGAMQRRVVDALARIRFDAGAATRFLGAFLTEPKPQVFFTRPVPALGRRAFAARIARDGLVLDRASQMLYDARRLYVNGAEQAWPRGAAPRLRRLADRRTLAPAECRTLPSPLVDLFHDWYRHGFLAPTPR